MALSLLIVLLVIVFNESNKYMMKEADFIRDNVDSSIGYFDSIYKERQKSGNIFIKIKVGNNVKSYVPLGSEVEVTLRDSISPGDEVRFSYIVLDKFLSNEKYLLFMESSDGSVLVDENSSIDYLVNLYSPRWIVFLKIISALIALIYIRLLFKGMNNE
ncbi:hypothetical protein [Motiliproteus sp.]|uniref:hypothetical protein n=1 Tax=Motiliproteus sp. TaxID=1898955 RepID=UPI003BA8B3EE